MSILFWRRKRFPVVELRGVIAARPGALNLQSVGPALEKGFALAKRGDKRLILAIESPGGSPVQSDLLGRFIRRRAEESDIKVTAVIGDVGASGGYWIACAADEIRANAMSIVGSIGVVGGGFGLDRLIQRLDIDRRIYTAGRNKARMDPFRPERPEDVAFTRELLDDLHGQFKSWVRSRRGTRLRVPEEEIFDGSYMTGTRGIETGLVDAIDDVDGLVLAWGGAKARPLWLRPRKPRGLLRLMGRSAVEMAVELAELRELPLFR
jgi:ClpP class serine protease